MDLLRMSHDSIRMICKYRLQQLQAIILNKVYRREKFRLLSISQETYVVDELEEGIRRESSKHIIKTYTICIQCRAIY